MATITMCHARSKVASVYAPNSFDTDYLHTIHNNVLRMPEYNLIIGSDFNCAMNDIDRSTSFIDPRLTSALKKFVAELTDI